MRLVDRRAQGVALGVGSAKIIGVVHLVQLKLGNSFFAASLRIIEGDNGGIDFLLGLDQLKKHQVCLTSRESQYTQAQTLQHRQSAHEM